MLSSGVTGAARTAEGYLNNPLISEKAAYEMRRKGVFGALSRTIPGKTSAPTSDDRQMDVSKSAAVLEQVLGDQDGDEVDWSIIKRLVGAPTFGDRVPGKGGYLDVWHQRVRLNITRSDAFQLRGELDLRRLENGLFVKEMEAVKDQIVLWHAERAEHDHIKAFLAGASDNLLATTAEGGLGLDLGAGPGVPVSPLNIIVRGTGVIGGATLAAREANLLTALAGLSSASSAHLLTVAALQEASEELSISGSFKGIDMGGEEKFIYVAPSVARFTLAGPSSTYVDMSKYQAQWGENHPFLKMQAISVSKFLVVFDDTLAKYAPDVSGSRVVWGKDTPLFQSWSYKDLPSAQRQRGVGLVLGEAALRTASSKAMEFTEETGPHGVGREISAKIRTSIVRSQWRDMVDSTKLPFDQSCLLHCFAQKDLTHS